MKYHLINRVILGIYAITAASASRPALAQAICEVNGQEVPCDQLAEQAKGLLGIGIVFFLVMIVISLAATIFWILMIIHAASKPIENRALWIVIMVLTGIIGAIIYYFAVKRKFGAAQIQMQPPATPQAPPQTPPQAPPVV